MILLLTGGTGSFGRAFADFLLKNTTDIRLRIFSRDEHKQDAMAAELPPGERITYILGDVRDVERLKRASDGADAIVHAAALKRVPQGERHADEFTKTNVQGTANVIGAALAAGVRRSLFISSDKAVSAFNTYGKTKAVGEALFIHANELGVSRGCRFAVARGGNVWGSRGSVVEIWRERAARGETLVITDPDATRFCLPMSDWTAFCWRALTELRGGEIFTPKLSAWRLGDLAYAIGKIPITSSVHPSLGGHGDAYKVIGSRSGDKRNECLISYEESGRAVDAGFAYIVEPSPDLRAVWNYQPWPGQVCDWAHLGAAYSSDGTMRMSIEELSAMAGKI